MRVIAAYLLAQLGGKQSPQVADIEKILSSVGIEGDKERMQQLIGELDGKSVDEIIAKGSEKLSSVPSGGAAPAAAQPGQPAQKGEEKKEEKAEEKAEEESDDDMGFGLFD